MGCAQFEGDEVSRSKEGSLSSTRKGLKESNSGILVPSAACTEKNHTHLNASYRTYEHIIRINGTRSYSE